MSAEAAVALGLGIGVVGVLAGTPVAIRVAVRTGFLDRPREYRQHASPTPFLGGAAVLAAFLLAAVAIGAVPHYGVLLLCALAMWAIGTIDDRLAVAPQWRLLAEASAASVLFADGLGWRLPVSDPVNLGLTVVWCVGLVNAFNLMDNLDGACATVGGVSASALGLLAAIYDQTQLVGMAVALAAACGAFLRFNLARPARIFLGDGGSMPIGFLIAGLGMATGRHLHAGDGALLVIALTTGVVILDTTLVSVSRARRGVSLLTGGRDHLTHRLLGRLGTPHSVAGALALLQASLATLAILGQRLGGGAVVWLSLLAGTLGVLMISLLESERWRPGGAAAAPPPRQAVMGPAELEPSPGIQP